ncbi:hypothetical protein OG874_24440 [Nocardia sp. NBC_00565]|uniref:hypothetical protein n=1 Tax=Nocardia sp. NBC_00565 TaxID=2975993 RepID=UPI002E80E6FA|nr:hypothetical protein [Nocardia sp. NBC_00565]WUC00055.1 hypothetical protein OG874_24440 [Nocardia sp. NBC_00565]
MAELRVHNLAISLDGYVAGPDQGPDNPIGAGGMRLHEWVFASRYGREMSGAEGGTEGVDNDYLTAGDERITSPSPRSAELPPETRRGSHPLPGASLPISHA